MTTRKADVRRPEGCGLCHQRVPLLVACHLDSSPARLCLGCIGSCRADGRAVEMRFTANARQRMSDAAKARWARGAGAGFGARP